MFHITTYHSATFFIIRARFYSAKRCFCRAVAGHYCTGHAECDAIGCDTVAIVPFAVAALGRAVFLALVLWWIAVRHAITLHYFAVNLVEFL